DSAAKVMKEFITYEPDTATTHAATLAVPTTSLSWLGVAKAHHCASVHHCASASSGRSTAACDFRYGRARKKKTLASTATLMTPIDAKLTALRSTSKCGSTNAVARGKATLRRLIGIMNDA